MKKILSVLIIGVGLTASANADGLNGMVDEINKQKTLLKEHFSGKVESTIEFQKKGWNDGKIQLANLKTSILKFFTSK